MNRRSVLLALLLLPKELLGAVRNYTAAGETCRNVRNYKAKPPASPPPTKQPSCPGGNCPRLGPKWIERRFGYTTEKHLIEVHGFSPEIVAFYRGKLDNLHGSPDAPRNPHTYG